MCWSSDLGAPVESGVRVDECPFCDIAALDSGWEPKPAGTTIGRSSAAFLDNYPVTPGHMLVVPRRHVDSVFQLDDDERHDLWAMVALVADHLRSSGVTDMNIGTNIGAAAGQTVEHAHIHVIQRRDGDVRDPRGGIRWVIPEKARYWAMPNHPA